MPSQRIEVNVTTGKRRVIDRTQEEETADAARAAQHALENPPTSKQTTAADLAAALVAKGLLTKAELDAFKV